MCNLKVCNWDNSSPSSLFCKGVPACYCPHCAPILAQMLWHRILDMGEGHRSAVCTVHAQTIRRTLVPVQNLGFLHLGQAACVESTVGMWSLHNIWWIFGISFWVFKEWGVDRWYMRLWTKNVCLLLSVVWPKKSGNDTNIKTSLVNSPTTDWNCSSLQLAWICTLNYVHSTWNYQLDIQGFWTSWSIWDCELKSEVCLHLDWICLFCSENNSRPHSAAGISRHHVLLSRGARTYNSPPTPLLSLVEKSQL